MYRTYHDVEWGRPVTGDDRFFEKVCLEGFQSGLSWSVILHKRDAFREAFEGFEIERVARFTEADVERLATNPDIVRNRAKIAAAVHNAGRALALRDEVGALDAFFWSFEPDAEESPGRGADARVGCARTPPARPRSDWPRRSRAMGSSTSGRRRCTR